MVAHKVVSYKVEAKIRNRCNETSGFQSFSLLSVGTEIIQNVYTHGQTDSLCRSFWHFWFGLGLLATSLDGNKK